MRCPNCDSEIPALQDWCTACGRPIPPTDTGEDRSTPLPEDDVDDVTSFRGGGGQPEPTALETAIITDDEAPTIGPPGTPRPASAPPSGPGARDVHGPLSPGQAFGPRYHIVRLLGAGGMGAVYQAWDEVLGIALALKVILPDVAADPSAAEELERRFKRELLLARKVTHKNVVRIHDIGEINGIKYLTMSYVDGSDLQTILNEQGKLPVARALRVIRQVVSGMEAAHQAGVVHRDLKPANIMIDDAGDEALIMDFGIARATAGPATDRDAGSEPHGDARHYAPVNLGETIRGAVVGTLQYMAPEQAKGKEIGPQADIYALGLIFYDTLLGPRRSETTPRPVDELGARMKTAPTAVSSIDAEIPESLSRIISRCVEPDPAARYQTTAELAEDLERLDDEGQRLPITRRLSLWQVAALVGVVVALLVGVWWIIGPAEPPVEPDPVSVMIADFQNSTNDPAFDRTLEPMLRRGLEGAGFVTAYDRTRLGALGVPRPDRLDEIAARELAVQQGLGVVLSGSIDPQGGGYRISVNATQTVTGEVITSAEGRARSKDQVLDVATRLITQVRNGLGDDASESAQQFAMASLSATSLDVVGLYAAAMEAASGNRFDEVLEHAGKAVELDPNFGVGYLVLAVASGNLGRAEDGKRYLDEALRHLDGMTERERYSTRAYSYWATGDYEQCVKENNDLIALYPADVGGHNMLALCLSHLRDMRHAMEEMQAIVEILPSHPVFRDNLALYANYASDFQTAEQAARMVEGTDAYAALALAFAQIGQGQMSQAMETYETLGQIGPLGASFAASGIGELAAFEGRFSDAVRILTQGAADDLAAENSESAASKFAAIARAELSRGRFRAAIHAADEALRHSSSVKIRFLAARTFVEAGDVNRARPLIDDLGGELYAEPRAHAKILEGVIALKNGDAPEAMNVLRQANDVFDTWIGTFELGRASLAAGAFAQADGAFDVCLNARRGEALSLFVDEEPTYAYLPLVYYYQGRARENIGTAGYRDSYRQYLDIRGESTEDPLLSEVQERIKG